MASPQPSAPASNTPGYTSVIPTKEHTFKKEPSGTTNSAISYHSTQGFTNPHMYPMNPYADLSSGYSFHSSHSTDTEDPPYSGVSGYPSLTPTVKFMDRDEMLKDAPGTISTLLEKDDKTAALCAIQALKTISLNQREISFDIITYPNGMIQSHFEVVAHGYKGRYCPKVLATTVSVVNKNCSWSPAQNVTFWTDEKGLSFGMRLTCKPLGYMQRIGALSTVVNESMKTDSKRKQTPHWDSDSDDSAGANCNSEEEECDETANTKGNGSRRSSSKKKKGLINYIWGALQ